MKYAEICIDVDAADADRAEGALVMDGIAVEVRDHTTLLKPPPGRAHLVVYAEAEHAVARAEEALRALDEADVRAQWRTGERDDDEWLDTWKAFFKPRPVGPFVIVPSWETYEARPGEIILSLDPGRAFGTGGHASTRLCLGGIGAVPDGAAVRAVLDVGCGSGILGIGALLRWPEARATAIDVDSEAVDTTIENAEQNHVTARLDASATPIGKLAGPYDLVLANITAETIAALAADLARVTGPRGTLVCSGILVEQADGVVASLSARGMREAGRAIEDEWIALWFAKARVAEPR